MLSRKVTKLSGDRHQWLNVGLALIGKSDVVFLDDSNFEMITLASQMFKDEPPLTDAVGVRALFTELSDRLATAGVTAQLFVVGGAAKALAYDQDRLTHDVDALFISVPEVRRIAEEISGSHGLEPDWLNDAAKGGAAQRGRTSTHGVRVRVAAGAGALTGVHAGAETACLA